MDVQREIQEGKIQRHVDGIWLKTAFEVINEMLKSLRITGVDISDADRTHGDVFGLCLPNDQVAEAVIERMRTLGIYKQCVDRRGLTGGTVCFQSTSQIRFNWAPAWSESGSIWFWVSYD